MLHLQSFANNGLSQYGELGLYDQYSDLVPLGVYVSSKLASIIVMKKKNSLC